MMRYARSASFGAAVALLLAAPAHAQQDALSQDEVESYFDNMSEQITQMAQAGDLAGLVNWIEEEVADEARFYAGIETYAGEERKSFNLFMLDKQDMVNLGQLSLGLMASVQGLRQPIESYSLEVEVLEVVPAGPDAATVRSRMVERATFRLRDPQQAPEVTGAISPGVAQNGSISVEATADCTQLIRRSQDAERLVMGLTGCDATANF